VRAAVVFFAGFAAGMLFLLVLLWQYGPLQPVRAAMPTAPEAAVPKVVPLPGAPPRTVPPPPVALPQPTLQSQVPDLLVPVQGADVSKIIDTFDQGRDGRKHEAVDIMAPRGTPVLATAEGQIAKLFYSRRGGITIYQFDPSQTWCYYYAHLDRYAEGLGESMTVTKGQVIGYVGSTGDAAPEAPHLHFEISKLGPEKQWWKGTAINPYPILIRHARIPRPK
jgi:murein DD-endopeptidase MepM/ murein hydrolase activator NlpD